MVDVTDSTKDWEDFWKIPIEAVDCYIDEKKVDCSLLKDDSDLYKQIPNRY